MTRKDFTLVAKVVSSIGDLKTRNTVALDFASVLHAENDRFDTIRFLSACDCKATPSASQKENDFDVSREKFIAP
jgi:hypothetical protein|tara:strand:+ start:2714 stop:2938 length:225 start_codon:yes stop_codon:yes gene_type:complete